MSTVAYEATRRISVPASVREHRWYLGIGMVYVTAVATASTIHHHPALVGLHRAMLNIWGTVLGFGLIALILRVFWRRRAIDCDAKGYAILVAYKRAWSEVSAGFTRQRVATIAVPLAFAPFVFSAFSTAKQLITVIQPFAWDAALDRADLWLHGGVRPWVLIQPLFTPALTRALTLYYHWAWILIATVTFAAGVLMPAGRLRRRYLISLVLMFAVLGTGAATLISSAGPAYYNLVTGQPNPYAPLLAYLEQSGSVVTIGHASLWTALHEHRLVLGAGVSAFPSIHLAKITHACVFWGNVDRRTLWIGVPVVVLTLLCSMHLAWHYAVDGYAGIGGVLVLWWLAGKLAR